jgi:hypothetical protein
VFERLSLSGRSVQVVGPEREMVDAFHKSFQSWTILTTFIHDISCVRQVLESSACALVMIHREIIPNHFMNSMLQLQALFPDIKVMIFLCSLASIPPPQRPYKDKDDVGKSLMSQA